jgi:hypothetical protein
VRIPRPESTSAGQAARGSFWKTAASGWAYLLRQRAFLGLILFITLVNFIFSALGTVIVPYLYARTGSEAAVGGLISLYNGGALAGALLIGVWGGTRRRIDTFMPAAIGLGAALMLHGLAQTPVTLGMSVFFILFPFSIMGATGLAIMQRQIPADLQGRAFAAIGQLSRLTAPFSLLAVGPLIDRVAEPAVGGPGWERVAPLVGSAPGAGIGLMLVIGGLIIVAAGMCVYAVPSVRRLENRPAPLSSPAS